MRFTTTKAFIATRSNLDLQQSNLRPPLNSKYTSDIIHLSDTPKSQSHHVSPRLCRPWPVMPIAKGGIDETKPGLSLCHLHRTGTVILRRVYEKSACHDACI